MHIANFPLRFRDEATGREGDSSDVSQSVEEYVHAFFVPLIYWRTLRRTTAWYDLPTSRTIHEQR